MRPGRSLAACRRVKFLNSRALLRANFNPCDSVKSQEDASSMLPRPIVDFHVHLFPDGFRRDLALFQAHLNRPIQYPLYYRNVSPA